MSCGLTLAIWSYDFVTTGHFLVNRSLHPAAADGQSVTIWRAIGAYSDRYFVMRRTVLP